jgi:hypothetical protein
VAGGEKLKAAFRSCSIEACNSLLQETQRLFLFVPPTLLLLARVFALMLLNTERKSDCKYKKEWAKKRRMGQTNNQVTHLQLREMDFVIHSSVAHWFA